MTVSIGGRADPALSRGRAAVDDHRRATPARCPPRPGPTGDRLPTRARTPRHRRPRELPRRSHAPVGHRAGPRPARNRPHTLECLLSGSADIEPITGLLTEFADQPLLTRFDERGFAEGLIDELAPLTRQEIIDIVTSRRAAPAPSVTSNSIRTGTSVASRCATVPTPRAKTSTTYSSASRRCSTKSEISTTGPGSSPGSRTAEHAPSGAPSGSGATELPYTLLVDRECAHSLPKLLIK
ncbi:hypothetical protein DFR75_1182 [Nocardia ignorata]|uniref:Uncharacterized protein n=1 Tax=Nocardia ignorata TaxID=145285 RepID=A0A4V3CMD7_NOCIG|nr:hypothetical protein DFR75_1182 [Nocardia ignorata]